MNDSATALKYINDHNVLSLGTVGEQGVWTAAVFYVWTSNAFCFLSAPHTRHCHNIDANTRVSGTIQEDYCDWRAIKGIQFSGNARVVDEPEKSHIMQRYSEKFPIIGPDAPQEIAKALDKIRWYAVTPDELLFIDNSKGLGYRERVELDQIK